jgi:hypothetical protein
MNNLERFMMLALTSVLLAACGGGGYDAPAPGPAIAVAPGASESAAGLARYLNDLAAAGTDDKEPVDLGTFTPKLPEDTDPEALS